MSNRPIRILSNLARAGGTLVSKCVGSMENIVLLSEIHPLGTRKYNPLEQAAGWYNLLSPGEINNRHVGFVEAIQLIEQHCSEKHKTLIIRDWAHLDFIGVPFLQNPGYRLQLTEVLSQSFDIIQYGLVRHPIDQWLSTSRLAFIHGRLDIDAFLTGYRYFAEQCITTGFMRYEDFTREPVPQMQALCIHLRIDFDEQFITQWSKNRHVTGDMSNTSKGALAAEITSLPRRPVDKTLLDRFLDNPDYQRAIKLLGYTNPE